MQKSKVVADGSTDFDVTITSKLRLLVGTATEEMPPPSPRICAARF
jgi:hypothetical protein